MGAEALWSTRATASAPEADLLKPLDPPLKGEDLEELMFPQAPDAAEPCLEPLVTLKEAIYLTGPPQHEDVHQENHKQI